MGIIEDINEYARVCTTPNNRARPKYSTQVFDIFYTYFNDIYKKHGFSNMFIEKLVEIWYLKNDIPFIFSPRKKKNKSIVNKELAPGLYRNTNWYIYYDPNSIHVKTNKPDDEYYIAIKLPDAVAILYLWKLLDDILKWILLENE